MIGGSRAATTIAAATLVVVGLASCTVGTGHRAGQLADRIGVSVPPGATRLAVDDPPGGGQGSCSSLAFLLPRTEWKSYVGQYFSVDTLDKLDSVPGFCGHALIDCDGGALATGFQASGDHRGLKRSLEVIPDCVDGQAKIAWGTTG